MAYWHACFPPSATFRLLRRQSLQRRALTAFCSSVLLFRSWFLLSLSPPSVSHRAKRQKKKESVVLVTMSTLHVTFRRAAGLDAEPQNLSASIKDATVQVSLLSFALLHLGFTPLTPVHVFLPFPLFFLFAYPLFLVLCRLFPFL